MAYRQNRRRYIYGNNRFFSITLRHCLQCIVNVRNDEMYLDALDYEINTLAAPTEILRHSQALIAGITYWTRSR